MAGFYVYETADLDYILTGVDDPLGDYEHIVISIVQGGKRIDLTEADVGVEGNTIHVHLTQEQTGQFREGSASTQVNVYYVDTERDVSVKGTIEVRDNLYKQVMS